MKILLVRPKAPRHTIGLKNVMICEPLELEYIAGAINSKHEVEILDLILENKLEERIRDFKPDILGTSSYVTGVNEVKKICEIAKNLKEDLITVVGGVHASLNAQDFEDQHIDHVIPGSAFEEFNALIAAVEKGVDIDLKFDPQKKKYLSVNIQKLPLPRRELTQKYRHKYYYLFHQPVTIVKTTFGCPFKCSFCYCWELTDGKVYSRSPESVVEELLSIDNKEIYIIDDTFFTNKERAMEIHRLISEAGIKKEYLIYSHSDFVVKNPDIIKAWSAIGLKACIVGLESPNNQELESFRKTATVDINTEAINIFRQNSVDVYASFIIDPGWTQDDFKRLNQYIKKNKLYYIVLQPFTPIPGTQAFSEQEDYIVSREQYELWDMQHAVIRTALSEKRYYKEIRKIYLKTLFNPFRTAGLKLNTAPPVFSAKYLRLISGVFKIYMDLRKAPKHKTQV